MVLLTSLYSCNGEYRTDAFEAVADIYSNSENEAEGYDAGGGNILITWYLSPSLQHLPNLKIIDSYLSHMLKVLGRNAIKVQTLVRAPYRGERRPAHLLPIPVTDIMGRTDNLWSGIVLDHGDNRIVIPDVWEPAWVPVDFLRSLFDLAAGAPLRLLMLDGRDGRGLTPAGLSGRWNLEYWNGSIDHGVDIILIEDGPLIDEYENRLLAELREAASVDIPVIILSDGEWRMRDGLLKLADEFPADVSVIDDKMFDFRRVDSVLLERVGRGDFLDYYDPIIPKKGWGSAGRRIRQWAGKLNFFRLDPQKITSIDFSSDKTDSSNSGFTLRRRGDSWLLTANEWVLPARDERVEGFLQHLALGSTEAWEVGRNYGDEKAQFMIRLHSASQAFQGIEVYGLREAGGGVWIRVGNHDVLWPRLLTDEVTADVRYWMDRRLFPYDVPVTLMELKISGHLHWRIHLENEIWKITDEAGTITVANQDFAMDFMQQMLGSEAVTILPTTASNTYTTILLVENTLGHRRELRIIDIPQGYTIAESLNGISYILDEATVMMFLSGPIQALLE